MLSKTEQGKYRSILFRHLDGIAVGPTAYTLHTHGVLDYLLEKREADLAELTRHFRANEGYLNVALRTLASQGWLRQEVDNASDTVRYAITETSAVAFGLVPLYKEAVELMKFSEEFHPRKFHREPFRVLEQIFNGYRNRFGLAPADDERTRNVQEQVLAHIEGIITGPTVVILGMGGMFHKYFFQASFRPEEYHADAESFKTVLDFFAFLGWFHQKNETYRFTDKGLFFAKRASAYGVTVSYIPTFRKLDDLIFGRADILTVGEGEAERHVDREMNVWASGGAHVSYFQKVDDIIIELFNRPIEAQPVGVLDMGCGNGAFLEHIFGVIEQRTLRGKMLDEHPLVLVGADYNQAAMNVTRANLIQADIWAKVVWGDISRPDLLADSLSEEYGIDLGQLLNVRTFLDHNRIWKEPTVRTEHISTSTGAFAYKGKRLSNNAVEDNLLEHFLAWAPYLQKFGLLVIELHTIAAQITAQNLGKTPATAYDATHGFSDQYIVEADVFHGVAARAGLFPDERLFARFPDSELATVTVSLLKGKH